MRAAGHKGNGQDLGYLIKRAFRAHPTVKKAKRGKRGVRFVQASQETRGSM